MNPERWQQIERLYYSAVELEPGRRESFLEEACAGDQDLRREVELLLACQSKVEALCESPALEAAARSLARQLSGQSIPILTGRAASHYSIQDKLGEGGMGVVYKAIDTRLRRSVALKVLRPEAVSDPERTRRFVKEARAASALNHPNIITIHDIDQVDGVDFIVMEYVEGKSLDVLIPRSGMRSHQALKAAIQVAEGLSKAHAAGIIHRDLKPSNIMVTGDGLVKILDFGLAKLTEQQRPSGQETGRPSSISAGTEKGTVAGTAAYMSPEQAEGRPVDARSDIFAFGSVLYEMVTGRRAFQGDSHLSTLAAVLKEEPRPPSQLATDIPPGLERVIQRCLQKDIARRWQHIDDVKVELEELKAEIDSRSDSAGHGSATRHRWRLWAALAGIALAVAGVWLWRLRQVTILPPPRVAPLTSYPGMELHPTFSADGNQVAFSWDGPKQDNRDIYVKAVGETYALRLTTNPEPDIIPAWSPDGRQIAFYRSGPAQHRGIYLVSPLGGPEQKVSDASVSGERSLSNTGGFSWTPDGKWLAVAEPRPDAMAAGDTSGIFLISISGGAARRITAPQAPERDICPAVSPDGRRIAFARCPTPVCCDVYCLQLGSDGSPQGEPSRLTRQSSHCGGISWSRDGKSIIYSASKLWAMRHYLWRIGAEGGNPPVRLEYAGRCALSPAVAPLGNRFAFAHTRGCQDWDIWRFREGEAPESLIASSMVDMNPEFSPDGRKIAFVSDRAGETFDIWVANADGSGPVQLTHENGVAGTPRWSPDGQFIVFDLHSPEGEVDLYRVNVANGRSQRLTWEPSGEHVPTFSPDGNWIYFRSNRSGTGQFWRMPAGGGEAIQVTQNVADIGLVSADGETLYYTRPGEGLFAVPVTGGTERILDCSVSSRNFEVVSEGIYYLGERRSDGRRELCFLHPRTLQRRILSVLEGRFHQGLTVGPDRKTVLITRIPDPNSDLMLIENFR